jgi:hypothetical protein
VQKEENEIFDCGISTSLVAKPIAQKIGGKKVKAYAG